MLEKNVTSLEGIVSPPKDMEEINHNVLWSIRVQILTDFSSCVKSVETIGPNDNLWLIIHHSTGAFGIPQNGIENPQGLYGVDIVYTTHYFTDYEYRMLNGIFYTDNIAMVKAEGKTVYINPAYRDFLKEKGL